MLKSEDSLWGGSFITPCGSLELNSGPWAWLQVPHHSLCDLRKRLPLIFNKCLSHGVLCKIRLFILPSSQIAAVTIIGLTNLIITVYQGQRDIEGFGRRCSLRVCPATCCVGPG